MALYECVFIMRQDISSTQAEALGEFFSTIIKDNGGEVKKTEYWGLRNLAYKINKNRKGHYILFNIDAPSEAVLEMERNMRLNEDVMRHLTVRVEALEEGLSVVMQNRDKDRAYKRSDSYEIGEEFAEPVEEVELLDSPVLA